jgi:hypothetical protein
MSTFFSFLSAGISGSAHIAGAAIHAGDRIASTFFGFLGRTLSTSAQIAIQAGAWAFSLARRLTGVIGDVLRIAIGGVAAVVGVGMAGALKAQLEASGVLSLAQQSGRSVASAIATSANLRGFGVKAGDVGGLKNDMLGQQMVGAMWGVGDVGTPEGLAAYRQRFQGMYNSGPMGRMMASNMEGSMGTEALRGTALLPDELFNKQQQRSAGIQNTLGMNPRDVEKAAQNFTLLRATIEQLGSSVLTRIGTEVLPYLIKATDKAVDAVVANGDRIAAGIHAGVGAGVRALTGFGIFLVRDLPQMLFAGARFVLRGAAAIAEVGPQLGRAVMGIAGVARDAVTMVAVTLQRLFNGLRQRIGTMLESFSRTTVGRYILGAGGGGAGGDGNGTGMSQGTGAPRASTRRGGARDWVDNRINDYEEVRRNNPRFRLPAIPRSNSVAYAPVRSAVPILNTLHTANVQAGRAGRSAAEALGGDEGEQNFGQVAGYGVAGLATGAALRYGVRRAPGLLYQGARRLAGRVLLPATERLAFNGARTAARANPITAGVVTGVSGYEALRSYFPSFGESQDSVGYMMTHPRDTFTRFGGRLQAMFLQGDSRYYDENQYGEQAEAQSMAMHAARSNARTGRGGRARGARNQPRGRNGGRNARYSLLDMGQELGDDARNWFAGSDFGDIGRRAKGAFNGEFSSEPNGARDSILHAMRELDKRQASFDPSAWVRALEDIRDNTGRGAEAATKTAANTNKTADNMMNFATSIIAMSIAYARENDYLALMR